MKNFRKRCAALALAAALAFSLAQPALASYALGTELSAQATPLGTLPPLFFFQPAPDPTGGGGPPPPPSL